MHKLKTWISCFVVFGFVSCQEATIESQTPITIKMTDAPANYDAIYLNVDRVEVLTSGGKETFSVTADPFNILLYRMGRDTVIASGGVPPGTIQEVRLVLHEEGNTIVVDGVESALKTPSGQSSGVKLKVHDELRPGIAYTLLLDFDAAQSVVRTGNGQYLLKPVIRAIPEDISGVITGQVVPLESYANVYAIAGTDTVGMIIDDQGKFWLPGLSAGIYKLTFDPLEPYLPQTIENMILGEGDVKDVGTVVLETEE